MQNLRFRLFNNRCIVKTTLRKLHQASFNKNDMLSLAISDAEELVNYSNSFLNPPTLSLGQRFDITPHLDKIMSSNHPQIRMARQFLVAPSMSWGLIVLLISKAAGINSNYLEEESNITPGVLSNQRILAQLTEMILLSHFIHKHFMHIDEKASILGGDLLLGEVSYKLACLRNQNVYELMSSTVRDLANAEFIGFCDNQDEPYPNKPLNAKAHTPNINYYTGTKPYNINEFLGVPKSEWIIRNVLGGASLLAKSCVCALDLARHPSSIQELGYTFGKNVGLAWQIMTELNYFTSGTSSDMFSLVCAPVMMHLDDHPDLYKKIEMEKDDISKIDYSDLRKAIERGPGLQNVKLLQQEFLSNALNVLTKFTDSHARIALEKIIDMMGK